jgi:YD repeat-containing protein
MTCEVVSPETPREPTFPAASFRPLNRQTVTIDAQGNRSTSLFDLAGNLTGTLDSRGNLTKYLIDSLGRASVTIDANGNRSTSLFDAVGNVTGTLDANNNLTEFSYVE